MIAKSNKVLPKISQKIYYRRRNIVASRLVTIIPDSKPMVFHGEDRVIHNDSYVIHGE